MIYGCSKSMKTRKIITQLSFLNHGMNVKLFSD